MDKSTTTKGRKMKTKTARFELYRYFGMESGFKEIDVYVDLDRKHPDPAKLMIWGKDVEGNTVSDFKRSFTKTGRVTPLRYAEASTAHQEQLNKIDAFDEFLEAINNHV